MRIVLLKESLLNLMRTLQKEKKEEFLSVLLDEKKVLAEKKEVQSKPFVFTKEGKKKQKGEETTALLSRYSVLFDHTDRNYKVKAPEKDKPDTSFTDAEIPEDAKKISKTKRDLTSYPEDGIPLFDDGTHVSASLKKTMVSNMRVNEDGTVHVSESPKKIPDDIKSLFDTKIPADSVSMKENVRSKGNAPFGEVEPEDVLLSEKRVSHLPLKNDLGQKNISVAKEIKEIRTTDSEGMVGKREHNVLTQGSVNFKRVSDASTSRNDSIGKAVSVKMISEKEETEEDFSHVSNESLPNSKMLQNKTVQSTEHILKTSPEGVEIGVKENPHPVFERAFIPVKEKATVEPIAGTISGKIPVDQKESAVQETPQQDDILKQKSPEAGVTNVKEEKIITSLMETGKDISTLEIKTRSNEKQPSVEHGEFRRPSIQGKSEIVKEPSGGETSKEKDSPGNELKRDLKEISLKYEEKGKLMSFRELTDGRVQEMITRERAKSAYPLREVKRTDLQSVPRIVEKMYVQKQERATIDLEPPKLGKLEITITKENNELKIVFKVQTEEAKHILEHEIPKLVDRFNEKGLNAQVYVEREEDDYLYQENNEGSAKDGRREQKNERRHSDERVSFEEFIEGVKT
ncbi:flagellar hook-length control protein FliK [Thermotoga sp. SG1]|uniref:flagellar hook-length control protein FliK n=1 Tax=Thermotoga sp. SG1 TaxID=126739 RepID=UPI000C768459|nr:flagellar hook-length control protein FliK [Thermotoga sp. SG1]PLV56792.1 hypothetical protein AS006_04120 [Thermotoga sp. SG1]